MQTLIRKTPFGDAPLHNCTDSAELRHYYLQNDTGFITAKDTTGSYSFFSHSSHHTSPGVLPPCSHTLTFPVQSPGIHAPTAWCASSFGLPDPNQGLSFKVHSAEVSNLMVSGRVVPASFGLGYCDCLHLSF